MRKHTLWASATLALATIAAVSACGGTSTSNSGSSATSASASTCVNQSAPHHAYVVVRHESAQAQVVQKCVGFSGDGIDGQSLMDKSGINYQAQDYGGTLGKAVCAIDSEPAHYDKCLSDSGPWWIAFVDTNGQWTAAQSGYTQLTLHDKEALGWTYSAAASPSPPPLPKA